MKLLQNTRIRFSAILTMAMATLIFAGNRLYLSSTTKRHNRQRTEIDQVGSPDPLQPDTAAPSSPKL